MKQRTRPSRAGRPYYEHLFLIYGRGRGRGADERVAKATGPSSVSSPASAEPHGVLKGAARQLIYGPRLVWATLVPEGGRRPSIDPGKLK